MSTETWALPTLVRASSPSSKSRSAIDILAQLIVAFLLTPLFPELCPTSLNHSGFCCLTANDSKAKAPRFS
ncbi:protein of unknown function [Azospirillum baldaniorum]|uniref:Uncharacterized protein n=1 Tax=Azospirillum baldaniorum TaxID=1064539 RepID=A0A9P1NMZ5_9PROT|nr:protein of unknown function [Azospirillum baldaniorum]